MLWHNSTLFLSEKAKNHDDVLIPLIEKEAQYFQGIYILFGYDLQNFHIKCWKVCKYSIIPFLILDLVKMDISILKKPRVHTLESGIDVGQGIILGPGKFVKKNKCRALNQY